MNNEQIYKFLDKLFLFGGAMARTIILIPVAVPVLVALIALGATVGYDINKRTLVEPSFDTLFDMNTEKLIKEAGKVYFKTVHYTNRNNVLKQYMKFFVIDKSGKEVCINNYMSCRYARATTYIGKKAKLKDTLIVKDMDLYFINQELNKRLRKDINFEVRYAC